MVGYHRHLITGAAHRYLITGTARDCIFGALLCAGCEHLQVSIRHRVTTVRLLEKYVHKLTVNLKSYWCAWIPGLVEARRHFFVYCRSCISSSGNSCPRCKVPFYPKDIRANKSIVNIVNHITQLRELVLADGHGDGGEGE